ncbi:MAG TPA: aminopeptidase [Thermoplasmata archaeon]|jgi:leucyl aminopeptidase (aminopeptidase T)
MVTSQKLARSIVRGSLQPKEYESVIITTYPHTIELAEAVALECQKAGADPLLVLDSDALFYGQFKNYSLENLRKTSAHCLGLLDYNRSYVWLGGPKNPAPMAKVPQERFAAMFQGEQAHGDKALEKKPKSVGVEIGMVTRERSKTYGFNYAKWKESVEAAIATDYRQLEAMGKKVAAIFAQPSDVHVTAENGTDLRFRLAGSARTPRINDGVISDEDLAAGNPDAQLPAGAVWVAPVEESAEGTFVCDVGIPQVGRVVEGLSWTFGHGHVKDFTAKRNVTAAQTNWAEGTGAKDMFGSFGLGLNRRAKAGFLTNYIVSGAVGIGIGDNRDLGGVNHSNYGFAGSLVHGTVTIGGTTVIQDGKWRI